ncbi:MAG: hypothetical protein ABR929_02735 [Roseiarcus sp.]|jgi:hypothetical protein
MRKEAVGNRQWAVERGGARRRRSRRDCLLPTACCLFFALAAAAPACAQDAAQCSTVAEAEQIATVFGGQSFVTLTPAQAALARSMFSIATLESAPGDEVAISLHSDGTAYVYFLDRSRDQACSPIRLVKDDVAAVISAKGQ